MSLSLNTKSGFEHLTQVLMSVRDDAKSERGTLAALSTAEKGSLVAALNELKSQLDASSDVSDTTTTASSTWSSSKITSYVTQAINDLIGGADVDSDSLKELADQIVGLTQADQGLVSASASQSFDETSQQTARDNIGAASAADMTAAQATLTALGNRITQEEAKVSTLQTQMTAAQASISNIQNNTYSKAEIGSVTEDFVAAIDTVYTA